MKLQWIFLITIAWFPAYADDYSDVELFDVYETRSRLLTVNGNMYFRAGNNKNITFVTAGEGSIWFANTDISKLPALADFNSLKEDTVNLKTSFLFMVKQRRILTDYILRLANSTDNLYKVSKNISIDVKSLREWRKDRNVKDVRLRRFLGRISKAIRSLLDIMTKNGCNENPCTGGSTCIPHIGTKVICLCPPHRTGDLCENDVDECETLEEPCQNNGTCENVVNGYICHCPRGFHGRRCQYEHSSCRKTPGLCGNGICVDADIDSQADYKCICNDGYKPSDDPENPTCIDVDECQNQPCHPGVDCVNLPGSFQCSGCPKGFHGNGRTCMDVDECAREDYPCSLTPKVACFNTIGSYLCASCPAGYRGDGRQCTRTSPCTNKPCHPLAECREDLESMNVGGFMCICATGYIGDGMGSEGCYQGNSTVCKGDDLCLNGGTCRAVSNRSYQCMCENGYYGGRCEKASKCISSPCQNGGECIIDAVNDYTCICKPGFYGVDCEMEEDVCGQHIEEKSGNFTFPDDFGNVTNGFCDIVIQPISSNQYLKVTFLFFADMITDSRGPIDCSTTRGNVTLYDGDNENSPVIKTFCGPLSSHKAPIIEKPITMTGSRAMFRFKGKEGRFGVRWELKDRSCGYRTNMPGKLTVPAHHLDTACEWYISAPADKYIEIEIPSVEFTSGSEFNCSINELEIFDGYISFEYHRLLRACSSQNDTVTLRSVGPFLTVVFKSNTLYGSDSPLQDGFEMKYRFFTPDNACGGDIVNTEKLRDFSGIITTPNWGGFYPKNIDCTWKLDIWPDSNETSTYQSLKLEFLDFNVPGIFVVSSPNSLFSQYNLFTFSGISEIRRKRINMLRSALYPAYCMEDYLRVSYDGQHKLDACDTKPPLQQYIFDVPQIVLQFHSGEKHAGRGFRIRYSSVCEKRLSGNGTIQTWNYPDGGHAGKCTYYITAGLSHAITLKFQTVRFSTVSAAQCFLRTNNTEIEDYVEISGGREDYKHLNQRYYCSRFPLTEGHRFTMSAEKPLKIVFSSSGDPRNRGLLLEYETIDVGCGGVFTSSGGVITSPNYPERYLPHMHCVYQINVLWSKNVRLTFEHFDLEIVSNDDCTYDRVEIYDRYISETNKGKLLGKFCGSMIPPSILSDRYQMAVVFFSDRSVAGNGFSARYESVDANVDCDRTFTEPSGTIIFDGSSGRYGICEFHIALSVQAGVIFKINNASIPCGKGKLQIRNGATSQAPGFPALWSDSQVCDNHMYMGQLRSHGNRVYLKLLATDSSKIFFNISYEQIESSCGGRISGVSGSIAAPQYPLLDTRPMECKWTIAVALGNRVRLSVVMLDDLNSADENGFCGLFAMNRLDIMDGPTMDSRLIRRYCKKSIGSPPYDSDDHEMAVYYKQHSSAGGKALFGFLAHFTTECNGITLTDYSGSIQSPGYPDKVYTNRYCSWIIQVPKGNRIALSFKHFLVEERLRYGMPGCIHNYLSFGANEIAQGDFRVNKAIQSMNSSITNTCSPSIEPIRLQSSGNILHITFQSKGNEENNFWLTWHTVGCGGEIITPQNVSVSKTDMDPNADIYECFYKIQAKPGFKIRLTVHELNTFQRNPGKACAYNDDDFSGFETFAGVDARSNVSIDSVCDGIKNQSFQSHSSDLFVRLKVHKNDIMTSLSNSSFFSASIEFLETSANDKDDCGGIVQVKHGQVSSVHSPRYPSEYPRGTFCRWVFQTSVGHRLQLTLKEYTTPNGHPQKGQPAWRPVSVNNLTCQYPLPALEGSLSIYQSDNVTNLSIIDRICLDITQPKVFDIGSGEAVARFEGASAPRLHMSSEDETNKKVGFVLEARAFCGGIVYADELDQTIELVNMAQEQCNITVLKRNPDASGIVLRIDKIMVRSVVDSRFGYQVFASSIIEVQLDDEPRTSRTYYGNGLSASLRLNHEELRAKNKIEIGYTRTRNKNAANLHLTVSTDIESCGVDLTEPYGTISVPSMQTNFECTWTINTSPGNRVMISSVRTIMPVTPNCTESYFEVRRYNESGPLVLRVCEAQPFLVKSSNSYYIRMRYLAPSPESSYDDETETPVAPKVTFRYAKIKGGVQETPGAIENPDFQDNVFTIWRIPGEAGNSIMLTFEKLAIPYDYVDSTKIPGGLYIFATDEAFNRNDILEGSDYTKFVGFERPDDLIIKDKGVTILMSGLPQATGLGFRLNWKRLNGTDHSIQNSTTSNQIVFNCGTELPEPTYEWQELSSPTVDDPTITDSGYPNNMKCKWTIQRPRMSGIEVQVVKMDLEDKQNCMFDYVSLVSERSPDDEGRDILMGTRLCRKTDQNFTIQYTYNKLLNVYFISDRSRGGSGFVLKYRKTCSSFDFIKSSEGIFNHKITIPPPSVKECSWILVLGSNRPIRTTIYDLDLYESPDCTVDYISVKNRNFAAPNISRFCGKREDSVNITSTSYQGKIFINYSNKPKGDEIRDSSKDNFVLEIQEVVEDCSNVNFVLDEYTKSMMFYSPGYPHSIPHSIDCEYSLQVPTGHRLQFTVNPREFMLESSNDECICDSCDWLEIHDGATAHSPLVGKYCGTKAPSTVYSTGNMLFLRIRTDSFAPSQAFSANFSIATCGGTIVLGENQTSYVRSPNYPDLYPDKSECQWTVHAPNTHMIEARLNHLWLPYSVNCTTSYVNVRDGNATDPFLIESQCNSRQYDILEYRTLSSLATVDFKSNVTTHVRMGRQFCQDKKCGFELQVRTSEVGCGGIINDDHGTLLPPGYPNKLLPHVKCRWEFFAGIGHRYLFEIEFTDPKSDGFYQERFSPRGYINCFPDVVLHNGGKDYEKANIYSPKYFCSNDTTWISQSDASSVLYSDSFPRDFLAYRYNKLKENMDFYVPFRINYTKVPVYVDQAGCSIEFKKNGTHVVRYDSNDTSTINTGQFCHLAIERPDDYGTTTIIISNYSDGQASFLYGCTHWNSFIDIKGKADKAFEVDERICHSTFNGKSELIRTFTNKNLDINIVTLSLGMIDANAHQFNMEIIFQKCGGVITEPNMGVITSPNFGEGRTYLPNSHCEWILMAPEGQQVEITITDLDAQNDVACKLDSLIVSEGKHDDVIHRYCLEEADASKAVQEYAKRNAKIRSQSRYLVLAWHTDSTVERRGFRLDYEFVDLANGCGFHSVQLTGTIHSPSHPESYPPDQECIWDIQVPRGYHVELSFSLFDIEISEKCVKDALIISEEHHTSGKELSSEDSFVLMDEEKHAPLCGYQTPAPIRVSSNRMRVNFTSDSKLNGRGFKAEWKAVCGAVYTQPKNTIESPHYPIYYPNEDMVCEYLINPTGEYSKSHILVRFNDFDLSTVIDGVQMTKKRFSCDSDYIEIIETETKRSVVFCAGDSVPDSALAFKGAVGIRFTARKMYNARARKLNRGFRLSYEIQTCGGDIQLGYDEAADTYSWSTRIVSPAFPLPYLHQLNCSWNISAPSDRVLVSKLEYFLLEVSNECAMDYLEIYDGTVASNKSRIAKYCDNNMLPRYDLRTKSSNMLVNFVTDSTNNDGGFVLVVTATLGPEHGCGGTLSATDDWKTLTPPKDSSGNYLESLDCGWTILGPDHSIVEVRLTEMQTEKLHMVPGVRPKRVCVDSLAIYDGYRAFSPPLIEDLCTETVTSLPAYYHSSHRVIHAHFKSDSSNSASGFKLDYRIKKSDCGKWLTATDEVQTETYESKAVSEAHHVQTIQRCQWIIQSKEQIPIWVQLKNLNFTKIGSDCSNSFVEIRDVGLLAKCEHPACAKRERDKRTIRYCGDEIVSPFVSNTMVVQITTAALISDEQKSSFSINYELLENCNRTINLNEYKSGRLTSPHYPQPYSSNTSCETTLISDTDQEVLLTFNRFSLEEAQATLYRKRNITSSRFASPREKYHRTFFCTHDYVQVSDNDISNSHRYCGIDKPPTYFNKTKSLKIFFKSDESNESPGYNAVYTTVKKRTADEIVFNPIYEVSGGLTNVEFPNKYKKNMVQRWTIIPPNDRDCIVMVTKLSLGLSIAGTGTCADTNESLQMTLSYKKDGVEQVAKDSVRTCSHGIAVIHEFATSEDRKLSLTFTTDDRDDNDGVGFRMIWNCDLENSNMG
ncbi:unnamed protein product [Auanema sp. JU1783]|nr:unnamed protein product [Auanema sp. JU1783]